MNDSKQYSLTLFLVAGAVLFSCLLVGVLLLLPTTETLNLANSYTVVDLSQLDGRATRVFGFNGIGDVVGDFELEDGNKSAFLWSEQEGLLDLGGLGGASSRALSINDDRTIVGFARNAEGFNRAFIWDQESGISDLGDLGGKTSLAVSVTPQGTVVGESATEGTSPVGAFQWSPDKGFTNLGDLGGIYSSASVGNLRGDVVGRSLLEGQSITHGFVWTASAGMVDLGSLGLNLGSNAYCINNQFFISGSAEYEKNRTRAIVWDASREIHELGTLGGLSSVAFCINDNQVVVGYSETDEGFQDEMVLRGLELWGDLTGQRLTERNSHAFIYDLNEGRMIDLNDCIDSDLGWDLIQAVGIDNDNRILANAIHDGKQKACFLLPSSTEP